jgi:DNA-binding MarR family transcriptional regulator
MSTRTKPAPLDLDRFLPYRLDILAEAVSRALSRIYKERYGLGVPEWRVLAHLGQYAPITAKAIGAHSRMHKTKVSRAVAALEALGFLARNGNNEDRREELLSLTAKGKSAYADLAPQAADFAQHLLDGLSAGERRVLEHTIDRLLKKFERDGMSAD